MTGITTEKDARVELPRPRPPFERYRPESDLLQATLESAEHVHELFEELQNPEQEKLLCFYLTEYYNIISFEVIAIGHQEQLICNHEEILRAAVLFGAKKLILVRNHPKGPYMLNQADIQETKQFKEKADILQVILSEIVIVDDEGHYSYSYHGVV
jgi:DNA repair protein RadC